MNSGKKSTIAIQGELGSFHHAAAKKLYPNEDIEYLCLESFDAVFEALRTKKVDGAVVAIENTIFGTINDTYRLLQKHRFSITGEWYLPIEHCLIVNSGVGLRDIGVVKSHAAAIAQCRDFLSSLSAGIEIVEVSDTAGAVMEIKDSGSKSEAAIASKVAAELYGLEILNYDIGSNDNNYTRFITVSREDYDAAKFDGAKYSIILETSHESGALAAVLECFSKNNVSLEKIESRPLLSDPKNYSFIIDFICSDKDRALKTLDDILAESTNKLIVIGQYKNHEGWWND